MKTEEKDVSCSSVVKLPVVPVGLQYVGLVEEMMTSLERINEELIELKAHQDFRFGEQDVNRKTEQVAFPKGFNFTPKKISPKVEATLEVARRLRGNCNDLDCRRCVEIESELVKTGEEIKNKLVYFFSAYASLGI